MAFRLSLILTLFTLSACGSAGNLSVKSVDLGTSSVGSDTYVTLTSIIKMGNLKLPGLDLPILNPSTMKSLGQLSMSALPDGTNQIIVQVDYNQVAKLDPSAGKTLPNGRELPVSLGIGNSTIIGIPILQNSKIYVGGDLNQNFYLGVALAIPFFDSVLTQVPMPLNIFFPFAISSSLSGSAGVFSGPSNGQNGIGIFAKRVGSPGVSAQMVSHVVKSVSYDSNDNEMDQMDSDTLYELSSLFNHRRTVRIK